MTKIPNYITPPIASVKTGDMLAIQPVTASKNPFGLSSAGYTTADVIIAPERNL